MPPDSLLGTLSSHPDRLPDLLAQDAVFHSPVTDYRGRANVTHILSCIGQVLEAPSVQLTGTIGGTEVTVFSASVGSERAEAVLLVQHDQRGQVVDATLYVRPYAVLKHAIKRMAQLLENDPLPG